MKRWLKKLRWYFLVHTWWRDLCPWWVLKLMHKHFNVCWASLVSWKMLDSETGLGVAPICGATNIPDGKGGWVEGWEGSCYCGTYRDQSEFLRDCQRPAWARRLELSPEMPAFMEPRCFYPNCFDGMVQDMGHYRCDGQYSMPPPRRCPECNPDPMDVLAATGELP